MAGYSGGIQRYKDAVRLRREEVRRTKGWLELNLDATVKDNKNVFVST